MTIRDAVCETERTGDKPRRKPDISITLSISSSGNYKINTKFETKAKDRRKGIKAQRHKVKELKIKRQFIVYRQKMKDCK